MGGRVIDMTKRKASPVELADCPEDGGKYIIYCEHFDDDGNLVESAILQDTNRRRLNAWRTDTLTWCCYCQEGMK
jgi:hypothetical protein